MSVSDELLDKYFKGQCSPEERLQVAAYLNETDDLPSHLLSKEEWDQTSDAAIDEVKTEEMFNVVKKQTIAKVYRLKWIKITSAAAVVLAVLLIGLFNWPNNKSNPDLAKSAVSSVETANQISWKSIVNYTENNQLFTLPDNSTVNIFPGAELRYAIPFVKNKREVYLSGKSFFNIAKDSKHPFVVYAKGISTTALGTSFTITALSKSRMIKVQLHTGKVLVKSTDSLSQISRFTEVLLPGKELVYNSLANKVSVSDSKALSLRKESAIKELNFTQAPLVDVFEKLEKHYHVKIAYDHADLSGMSFTGSLKLTQPITAILGEIAELNKLNQIKTTEGYLIRK
ncbi:FecR family protein [Pedobacter caeni]|uniref:FecR family protein n=1 Tax=Pedobacter caeni TaxID=288992 RepID=A0A1M4TYW7_9SPHI|nr:FecR family protein [Pedobacter caeni]SHE49536.1 FecR family protein [Pedobacter caeni]